MICVLKFKPAGYFQPTPTDKTDDIVGWFIANDMHDARRKASATGEHKLAAALYAIEWELPPGKHALPSGHLLLID